jgi:hypothetical protein
LPSIFALAGTPPSMKSAAAQTVAVVDQICATAGMTLRMTAALLGVEAFAALGSVSTTACPREFIAHEAD